MTIWLLAAAVSVLLLVSCLNVANLLFARGLYRRHEMMIRATLGASRWQVIRQLLLETILLTAVGGVVGLFVAQICVQGTRSLMPSDLYRLQELHVDSNTLGFIFALILITSLLSGLLPAWSLSQVVLAPGLKDEGGRTGTGGPHRQRIQSGLVTAQVALTCVLLIAVGLLIRSFHVTQTVKLGFNPSHLFTAGINLTSVKYENDDVKTHAFWDELMTKIRRIPSVTDAALNNNPPLKWDRGNFSPFTVDGQPNPEPDHEPILTSQTISSDYFRTMQIPILQGRDFDSEDRDDKPNVVDEALAKHYFPDQNPISKSIGIGRVAISHCTIVGVVPHICHQTPGEAEIPFQAYSPYAQIDPDNGYLIIRSNLNSASLAAAVRQTVASIDPGVPIFDVHSYDDVIAQRFLTRRLSTLLVALFSGAALFLSAVGLYGILSYFVGQKSREIGIRMALGAQARNILRLVVAQGLWPVGVGLTIGILAGLLLACFMDDFLYGVSAYDPITLALTVFVLGTATLLCGEGDTDQPYERSKRIAQIKDFTHIRNDNGSRIYRLRVIGDWMTEQEIEHPAEQAAEIPGTPSMNALRTFTAISLMDYITI